jgi:nitric oxide reductase subunit C
VYAYSTKDVDKPSAAALAGFDIWQAKNCQACHQIYGLGGSMGPDLTNIISDTTKGGAYASAFIKVGSQKMPNFNFSDTDINKLIAFLTWVDKSGRSVVPADKVNAFGNYKVDNK